MKYNNANTTKEALTGQPEIPQLYAARDRGIIREQKRARRHKKRAQHEQNAQSRAQAQSAGHFKRQQGR